MKPRYGNMEIAIMLDSNENAFKVHSEKFGKIYFLRLADKGALDKSIEWREVTHEKWKKNTGASIECGYAVIYKASTGSLHLDAIFDIHSQFKQKLIRFRRWWANADKWEEEK